MNTREMTDKFQDWKRQAGEKARSAGQAADEYVRDNTWTTVAVAAILGCVLGYILSGRRD